MERFFWATTWVIPVLLSLVLHETAHGWAALWLGDKTALKAGRLSLNPLNHIDPLGTVLIPAVLFLSGSPFLVGWAKPVPVDFGALRYSKKGVGLVAFAGPFMNVVLAIFSVLGLQLLAFLPPFSLCLWVFINFQNLLFFSLSIAAFNLLPVLPLDGGRILTALLPDKWARQYGATERYGLPVLFMLLVALPMLKIDIVSPFVRVVGGFLKKIVQVFIFTR